MRYADKTYHANLQEAKLKAHTLLDFFSESTDVDASQVSQKDKDEMVAVNQLLDQLIKFMVIGTR